MSEFAPEISSPPSEVIVKTTSGDTPSEIPQTTQTTTDNPPSEVSQPKPTYVAWYARRASNGFGDVLYTNQKYRKEYRLRCSVAYECDGRVLMGFRKRSSPNIFDQYDFYCKDCFETHISTLDGRCIDTARSIMSYSRRGTDIMFINQGDALHLKRSIEGSS